MSEKYEFEKTPEHIPKPEGVQKIFEQLTKGKSFETVRTMEDEKGLYLWDIKIPDSDGGTIEYTYMRAGRYEIGDATFTAIHITYFDKDGMPISGRRVAKYVNQKWIEII